MTGAAEQESEEFLKLTPGRYAWMLMNELLFAYVHPDYIEKNFTMFPVESKGPAPVVAVRDIPFYSLCAHHGLPFFGKATVVYLPKERLAGLSKFPRAVKHFASKFQTQERLGDEIADFLVTMLDPHAVMVVLHGQHLCMAMRGASVAEVETRTVSVRGTAVENEVKSEFYRLIQVI